METSRISLNQIEVSTAGYRWAHGHAPKGKGTWAFAIGNRQDAENDPSKVFWSKPYTMYSDAVKEAKKEAQKRCVTRVYVLS